jgi:hypothetical protein
LYLSSSSSYLYFFYFKQADHYFDRLPYEGSSVWIFLDAVFTDVSISSMADADAISVY